MEDSEPNKEIGGIELPLLGSINALFSIGYALDRAGMFALADEVYFEVIELLERLAAGSPPVVGKWELACIALNHGRVLASLSRWDRASKALGRSIELLEAMIEDSAHQVVATTMVYAISLRKTCEDSIARNNSKPPSNLTGPNNRF